MSDMPSSGYYAGLFAPAAPDRPVWPNSGHFAGKGRYRKTTGDDVRAKRKQVAKRRAKKGHK
jgi:hypothetical protein